MRGRFAKVGRLYRTLLMIGALLLAPTAHAWEADVHYGLTYWLAVKAGFDEREARLIATGNQRVDSGDMQYIEPMFGYACVNNDDVGANRVLSNHYPAAAAVPNKAEMRSVTPDSDVARRGVTNVLKVAPAQAGAMLHRLGEALHPVQDSWAHQGVPDVPPATDTLFACDGTRVWAHPKSRGGWNVHKADLTQFWPADVVATAKATYEVLTRFPATQGAARRPESWEKIRPLLDGFIKAATKQDKARWFAAQGIEDVSFLQGITLKDGAKPFDAEWQGRRFPPVPTHQSRQHHVDEDLLDFFHGFFERWVSGKDFAAIATEFAATPAGKAELAARLKLWRLRDHGRVAELAHSSRPLSSQQRASVDAIANERDALANYESAVDAYFPLLPRTGTKEVSPLLPFVIRPVAPNGANQRAAAVVKFRHVPYDVIAVVAEKSGNGWRVIGVVAAPDH
jgi:hypothetical protein